MCYNMSAIPVSCVRINIADVLSPTIDIFHQRQYGPTRGPNAEFLDCRTCLAHNQGEPGLGFGTLHNLPAENTSYVANMLLRQGAWGVVWGRFGEQFPAKSTLIMRRYPNDNLENFLDSLQGTFFDIEIGGGTSGVDYKLGLQAAHVTAWLPLLSIIGAEMQLPKVPKEEGVGDRPFLTFELQIQWGRAVGVLIGIVGLELLAIVLVLCGCRGVPLRDHDSYLAVGRLLRTVLNEVEGKSVSTGEDLAKWLHDKKGLKLRYGTRNVDGEYEVDLVKVGTDGFPNGSYR
jgi:hypothetical protein